MHYHIVLLDTTQQRSLNKKQVDIKVDHRFIMHTTKASAPRRLAPQRKRKTTFKQSPPQSLSSNITTSTNDDDINNQKVQNNIIPPASNLPINISGCSEEEEGYNDDHKIGVDLFNEHTITNEEESGNGIAKNIADWTTLDNAKKECTVEIIDDTNVNTVEEPEKEYHGELESTCSNSPPDNNLLDTDGLNGQGQSNDNEDEEHDDDDIFHIITEEQISLYPPPPSRPLVLVNLVELCGCPPEDEDEKLVLVSQLMEALLGNKEEEGGGGGEEQDDIDENKEEGDVIIKEEKKDGTNKGNGILGDGLSLDFDERMVELFESGVASHVDSSYPIAISCLDEEEITTTNQTVTPYAVVQYPEFLSDHHQQQQSSTATRSTMRLWKLLYTVPTQDEQINPLLSKIFTHLRNTSRSLLWKADMHYELSILSKKEYMLQIQRTQLKEYNAWKETDRRERLDKLYEVRETFLVRVGVAKKKYDALVEEREGRVDRELHRRGLFGELKTALHKENDTLLPRAGSSMGGEEYDISGYDDEDDGWGGTICEDDILGEETSIGRRQFDATVQEDEEEVEEENDEWAPLDTGANPLGMNIALDGVKVANDKDNDANIKPKSERRKVTNKLEPISHDDNIKRKSDRMQKKQDQLGPTSSTEQRSEYLKREQESICEMLKTNDERIAEATLLKLEERLQKVDDLLESLQEEEWADEEDDEGGKVGTNVYEVEDEKEAEGPILLDQILSMILGVLPKEKNASGIDIKTDEEHYKYLKEEHNSIVKEWKEVFGRLPPFPSADIEPKPVESEKVDGDTSFGDVFVPPDANFIVSQAEKPVVGNTSLTLIGNDDSNWDDVDDWDAVFPS